VAGQRKLLKKPVPVWPTSSPCGLHHPPPDHHRGLRTCSRRPSPSPDRALAGHRLHRGLFAVAVLLPRHLLGDRLVNSQEKEKDRGSTGPTSTPPGSRWDDLRGHDHPPRLPGGPDQKRDFPTTTAGGLRLHGIGTASTRSAPAPLSHRDGPADLNIAFVTGFLVFLSYSKHSTSSWPHQRAASRRPRLWTALLDADMDMDNVSEDTVSEPATSRT